LDGYRLGVDTGGTFTDLVLVDSSSGAVTLYKLPSDSDDPSRAISAGVTAILTLAAVGAEALGFMIHGTTVATNALLEHNFPTTGLLTTAGFRDVIEIGRQVRPHPVNLDIAKPVPIALRHLRLEIPERISVSGEVITPLDEEAVRRCARTLRDAGARAVAICYLHSYVDGTHELRTAEILREECPGIAISTSSTVMPEYREYERFSTTVLNAALTPVMASYLHRLSLEVADLGVPDPPRIMQSNGGIMGIEAASERPVNTLMSGPSAGVIGAAYVASAAGYPDIITLDMGGTSTDVALVQNATPKVAYLRTIGGRPVKAPSVDVHSIGAGGGSIGWIDAGGLPHVGPRSAGAQPGPACYGHGGEEPTVTDACVVLGLLSGTHLLGGRMPISSELAHAAVANRFGKVLDMDVAAAANAMLVLVTNNITAAIRLVSVERGYDPRDFTLVAYGGAGGLLAGRVARDLGMTRVLVPETPGLLCALGLLVADLRTDYSQTLLAPCDATAIDRLNGALQDLQRRAEEWLDRERVAASRSRVERLVDARYVGQDYEISVPVPSVPVSAQTMRSLADSFHDAHERLHGYASRDQTVQILAVRVHAEASVSKPKLSRAVEKGLTQAERVVRPVYFEEMGGCVDCPVLARGSLEPGAVITGPAVIEQMDSTVVVFPGLIASVDAHGNILLANRE
jgi:N-methylhydantoinase A